MKVQKVRNGDKVRSHLRTPAPLKKRHKRFKTSPRYPRTNVVTTPESKTDRGHKTAMPKTEALSLSSATQRLPRVFRHLITKRSERRPLMILPTFVERQRECECITNQLQNILMLPRPAGKKQAPMIASLVMP